MARSLFPPMERYFQAFVTTRPIEAGGQQFTFERVEPMGGSWLGVLAVDDESAANKLADAGMEISKERYDSLKKKVTEGASRPVSALSQMPQPPPVPLEVSANRAAVSGNSGVEQAEVAPARAAIISVDLQTTDRKPPPEPLVDTVEPKKRRVAKTK